MTRRVELWRIAPVTAALVMAIVSSAILAHRVFVSNDSLSTYAHIWYVSESIWERGRLPWRMPVLTHGESYAFPYGAPPWIMAALLWRVLGEWSVSLLLVLGGIASTLAAMRWQPALRQPLLLAIFLLNPFFIEMLVLAQYPYLWATVAFFLGAAAIRSRRYGWATLALAVAQITHPALMLIPVGVLVLGYLRTSERRLALLLAYAVSLVAATPAVWLTLATPALASNSRVSVLLNFIGTLAPRATVLIAPILLARFRPWLQRHATATAVAAVALPLAVMPTRRDLWAIQQLFHPPTTTVVAAIRDPSFQPGAVYRVLDAGDGKMSLYRVLRAGAVLDSDFFPESLERRSWPDAETYRTFLRGREVEYVVITRDYDHHYRTNERVLLRALVAQGRASQVYADGEVTVYRIE